MMIATTRTSIKKADQYVQTVSHSHINHDCPLYLWLMGMLFMGLFVVSIQATAESYTNYSTNYSANYSARPLIMKPLDASLLTAGFDDFDDVKNSTNKLNNINSDNKQAVAEHTNAESTNNMLTTNSLTVSTDRLAYKLPTELAKICLGRNNCPKIEVEYLVSNQPWIDRVINERINQLVVDSADMILDASDHNNSQDNNQALIKFDEVQKSLDDFAMAQFMDLPANTDQPYSLSITPSYLGQVKNIEQFQVNGSIDLGGEFGLGVPYSERMMFDQRSQQRINIDNLLLEGQQEHFFKLARTAYQNWIVQMGMNVQAHEQAWPFVLTKNISLGNEGVELMYQPYKIASYDQGSPVLTIPYQQLQGVLNPQLFSDQTSDSLILNNIDDTKDWQNLNMNDFYNHLTTNYGR